MKKPAIIYSVESLISRRYQDSRVSGQLHLVEKVSGGGYAYAYFNPESNEWALFRDCTDLERSNILFLGEQLAPTNGAAPPGYRRLANTSVAYA